MNDLRQAHRHHVDDYGEPTSKQPHYESDKGSHEGRMDGHERSHEGSRGGLTNFWSLGAPVDESSAASLTTVDSGVGFNASLATVDSGVGFNYKKQLYEYTRDIRLPVPEYTTTGGTDTGRHHSTVVIDNRFYKSIFSEYAIEHAEQAAAHLALFALSEVTTPPEGYDKLLEELETLDNGVPEANHPNDAVTTLLNDKGSTDVAKNDSNRARERARNQLEEFCRQRRFGMPIYECQQAYHDHVKLEDQLFWYSWVTVNGIRYESGAHELRARAKSAAVEKALIDLKQISHADATCYVVPETTIKDKLAAYCSMSRCTNATFECFERDISDVESNLKWGGKMSGHMWHAVATVNGARYGGSLKKTRAHAEDAAAENALISCQVLPSNHANYYKASMKFNEQDCNPSVIQQRSHEMFEIPRTERELISDTLSRQSHAISDASAAELSRPHSMRNQRNQEPLSSYSVSGGDSFANEGTDWRLGTDPVTTSENVLKQDNVSSEPRPSSDANQAPVEWSLTAKGWVSTIAKTAGDSTLPPDLIAASSDSKSSHDRDKSRKRDRDSRERGIKNRWGIENRYKASDRDRDRDQRKKERDRDHKNEDRDREKEKGKYRKRDDRSSSSYQRKGTGHDDKHDSVKKKSQGTSSRVQQQKHEEKDTAKPEDDVEDDSPLKQKGWDGVIRMDEQIFKKVNKFDKYGIAKAALRNKNNAPVDRANYNQAIKRALTRFCKDQYWARASFNTIRRGDNAFFTNITINGIDYPGRWKLTRQWSELSAAENALIQLNLMHHQHAKFWKEDQSLPPSDSSPKEPFEEDEDNKEQPQQTPVGIDEELAEKKAAGAARIAAIMGKGTGNASLSPTPAVGIDKELAEKKARGAARIAAIMGKGTGNASPSTTPAVATNKEIAEKKAIPAVISTGNPSTSDACSGSTVHVAGPAISKFHNKFDQVSTGGWHQEPFVLSKSLTLANVKNQLQTFAMKGRGIAGIPKYFNELVGSSVLNGPQCISTVTVLGKTYQGEVQKTRKLAEQAAAEEALFTLGFVKEKTLFSSPPETQREESLTRNGTCLHDVALDSSCTACSIIARRGGF